MTKPIDHITEVYNAAIAHDERGAIKRQSSPKVLVKIKRLHPDAAIPSYAREGDAGFDLVAIEDVIIEPGETALVKTGLAFQIPEGYELQVRPRSGVSLKTKLRVQFGTVDAGYRGEIGVIVDNVIQRDLTDDYEKGVFPEVLDVKGDLVRTVGRAPFGSYIVRKGDRIAQGVLSRVPIAEFTLVDELDETERGAGGFGSTGTKAVD